MHCLKVLFSTALKLAQPKVYNKYTLTNLADCMILPDKSDKKIFQNGVFNLQARLHERNDNKSNQQ
jgi:hypothetical protein